MFSARLHLLTSSWLLACLFPKETFYKKKKKKEKKIESRHEEREESYQQQNHDQYIHHGEGK